MAAIHCFIGIENLTLTAPQRATLVTALRGLGKQADPSPAKINHWRVRTDNDAAIFEAEFDDGELSISAFKNYLGTVFGIDPATITHTTSTNVYGLLVTLARTGTDRLRVLLFGGAGTTLAASRAAVRAYLAANAAAWGDVA